MRNVLQKMSSQKTSSCSVPEDFKVIWLDDFGPAVGAPKKTLEIDENGTTSWERKIKRKATKIKAEDKRIM